MPHIDISNLMKYLAIASLRSLHLDRSPNTILNTGLRTLTFISGLTHLSLTWANVSATRDYRTSNPPSLKHVDLSVCRIITDSGLLKLRASTLLRFIVLSGN